MARRSKRDYSPHIHEKHAPVCEADGCNEPGLYKAPRSRKNLHDYRYLCLEHIREHNKQWDYFSGMNEEEIEAFRKDAVTGHRPTWDRGQTMPNATEKLYAAVNDFFQGSRRKSKNLPQLSTKMRKAVSLFELEYPYTRTELKNRYKQLVKQYHPDRNAGDKLAEEKFKAVAGAYKVLTAHLDEQ